MPEYKYLGMSKDDQGALISAMKAAVRLNTVITKKDHGKVLETKTKKLEAERKMRMDEIDAKVAKHAASRTIRGVVFKAGESVSVPKSMVKKMESLSSGEYATFEQTKAGPGRPKKDK